MAKQVEKINPKDKKKLVPLVGKRHHLSVEKKRIDGELSEINGKIETVLIQADVEKCEVLDWMISRLAGTNVSFAIKVEDLPALLMQYVKDEVKAKELAGRLVKHTKYTYVRVDKIKIQD